MSRLPSNESPAKPMAQSPRVAIRARLLTEGFTLVEMLVVMSIVLILLGLAVPAISTMLRGPRLTQGGQLVEDQLAFARQTALSRNHSIEVRFYQFASPGAAGETVDNPSSGKFRALQLFDQADSGAFTPVGKVQNLPQSILIDSGSKLSPFVAVAQPSPGVPLLNAGSVLKVPIPAVATQYNCVSFRFLPDGSTDLPAFSPDGSPACWFLTLHDLRDGDGRTSPPANFLTLQIDASNGSLHVYRP